MKTSAFKGDFRLSSPYGWRIHPITKVKSFHNGVDFSMPENSELIVPPKFNGSKVRRTLVDKYDGKYIQLRNPSNGKGYYVLHVNTFKKKVGDIVKTGDLIALSGNTGHSTGAHTHIGVQKNATVWASCEDPIPYIIFQGSTMAFKKGDKVIITNVQHIRKGSASTVQGNSVIGQTGFIYDNPRQAVLNGVNYTWCDIHFDGGGSGWLADVGKFKLYVAPPEPTPPVEPDCKKYVEQVVTLEKENDTLRIELGDSERVILDMQRTQDSLKETLKMKEERIEFIEGDLEVTKSELLTSGGELEKVKNEKQTAVDDKLACQLELSNLKNKKNWLKEMIEKIVALIDENKEKLVNLFKPKDK